MAEITDTGITSTSLSEYKTELDLAFSNVLGADLDLDSQTPEGQIIGVTALTMSITDDAIVQMFQQLNIYNAAGNQLAAFGASFDISRTAATNSTVTATVTGIATTIIPVGSRAKTTNGDIFQSTGNITIASDGVGSGQFDSIDTGAIAIDAGTLTQIVDVVAGWETVNNSTDGTVGTTEETDLNYRNAYFAKLAKNAVGTVEAINSNVRSLTGVDDSKVFENDTGSSVVKQNVTLLEHSIAVIVNGGDSDEIGEAIYYSKTDGGNTAGEDTSLQTAVTVPTNDGATSTIIYYYPVEFITVTIDLIIEQYIVVADVIDQIKTAIINYFNGTLTATSSPIGIAESSYLSRLYTPINSVAGFDVVSLTQEIEGSGNPQSIITPNLNQQLIVTDDSISVTIQ